MKHSRMRFHQMNNIKKAAMNSRHKKRLISTSDMFSDFYYNPYYIQKQITSERSNLQNKFGLSDSNEFDSCGLSTPQTHNVPKQIKSQDSMSGDNNMFIPNSTNRSRTFTRTRFNNSQNETSQQLLGKPNLSPIPIRQGSRMYASPISEIDEIHKVKFVKPINLQAIKKQKPHFSKKKLESISKWYRGRKEVIFFIPYYCKFN